MALLLALLLLSGPAWADEATRSSATLPAPRRGTAAVWTGAEAFVFGGLRHLDGTDEIVRYDPVARQATVMAARLPTPRWDMSAVWDPRDRPEAGCPGGCAYLFGGHPQGGIADILQYSPALDEIALVGSLPTPRGATAAAWDGQFAYVVGGGIWTGIDDIIRFDPITRETRIIGHLPQGRSEAAATFHDGGIFILGGYGCDSECRPILRYDVGTGAIVPLPEMLGLRDAALISDGHHLFVFGGVTGFEESNWIWRIAPDSGERVVMSSGLPTARSGVSAVWTGRETLVFGGFEGPDVDEIVHHSLAPGPPQSVSVRAGPRLEDTTIEWTPPFYNTYSVLTGHLVYRSSPQGEPELIAELPASTTRFVDTSGSLAWGYEVRGINDHRDIGEARMGERASTLLRDTGLV